MDYYARRDQEGHRQKLKAHIDGVVKRSGQNAINNFESICNLAAMLHDLGKYSQDWQDYLFSDRDSTNRKCPHSPYGARFVEKTIDNGFKSDVYSPFLSEVLQYVISAHHGLIDVIDSDGENVFERRSAIFEDRYPDYESCLANFKSENSNLDFTDLFEKALREAENFLNIVLKEDNKESYQNFFSLTCLVRMLVSVLMDSDWSDAGSFFSDTENKWQTMKSDFRWDVPIKNLEGYLGDFSSDRDIDKVRQKITKECSEKYITKPGIYRMDIPTGGGKTLSAMDFALKHAKEYGKERIIYVAPYKTILEQTGEVYRKALFRNHKENESFLLEHYGDLIVEENKATEDKEKYEMYEYLSANWDAPIILTTAVQFLNTLLSGKKASVRRTHQLANSIIIIDEFQSIPIKSVTLLNLWLNCLSKFFDSTVLLCSATLPPFEEVINKEGYTVGRIDQDGNLVGDYSQEEVFKRVEVLDERDTEGAGYTEENIFQKTSEVMKDNNSLLIILNTRSAVNKLYKYISENDHDYKLMMLSNSMTPAHRRKKLRKVKEELNSKNKLVLISTSLIEAGVDISFESVIRSLTGLDSIAQSAGRCNRNGEKALGSLSIINVDKKIENLSKMKEVRLAAEKTEVILNDFARNPEIYDNSMLSSKAMKKYFKSYFEDFAKFTHYPIDKGQQKKYKLLRNADSILNIISANQVYVDGYEANKKKKYGYFLRQLFKKAGSIYEALEDSSIRIIVDFQEGADIVRSLNETESISERRDLLKKAEQFSISIYQHQLNDLKEKGGCYEILEGGAYVLRPEHYGESCGLEIDQLDEEIFVI